MKNKNETFVLRVKSIWVLEKVKTLAEKNFDSRKFVIRESFSDYNELYVIGENVNRTEISAYCLGAYDALNR